MDLLATGRRTVKTNENVSMLYIIYQGFLFASSIIGKVSILIVVSLLVQ